MRKKNVRALKYKKKKRRIFLIKNISLLILHYILSSDTSFMVAIIITRRAARSWPNRPWRWPGLGRQWPFWPPIPWRRHGRPGGPPYLHGTSKEEILFLTNILFKFFFFFAKHNFCFSRKKFLQNSFIIKICWKILKKNYNQTPNKANEMSPICGLEVIRWCLSFKLEINGVLTIMKKGKSLFNGHIIIHHKTIIYFTLDPHPVWPYDLYDLFKRVDAPLGQC